MAQNIVGSVLLSPLNNNFPLPDNHKGVQRSSKDTLVGLWAF